MKTPMRVMMHPGCVLATLILFAARASAGQDDIQSSRSAVVRQPEATKDSKVLDRRAPAETVLYSFGSATNDGIRPQGLIRVRDGTFYGTTAFGGMFDAGTVFSVTPERVETVLYSFLGYSDADDGSTPEAALVQGRNGMFYGTTTSGGKYQDGTVFEISRAGTETVLHEFDGVSALDGVAPAGALVEGENGDFYGTAEVAGKYGGGTVFKIAPSGAFTVIHSFGANKAKDGFGPVGTLIRSRDGHFFGTTTIGGAKNTGTVFEITPSGEFSSLYSFGTNGATDGVEPWSALTEGCDGNLYGTTEFGGATGKGTVFKLTRAGAETVLHSFGSTVNDGIYPLTPLIRGSRGYFYGSAVLGGPHGNGTVYRIDQSGAETVVYDFTYGVRGSKDGFGPSALIEGPDHTFYGTTLGGGSFGVGTVFKLTNVNTEGDSNPWRSDDSDCREEWRLEPTHGGGSD